MDNRKRIAYIYVDDMKKIKERELRNVLKTLINSALGQRITMLTRRRLIAMVSNGQDVKSYLNTTEKSAYTNGVFYVPDEELPYFIMKMM